MEGWDPPTMTVWVVVTEPWNHVWVPVWVVEVPPETVVVVCV
jgi:hypothetical protein